MPWEEALSSSSLERGKGEDVNKEMGIEEKGWINEEEEKGREK